MGSKSWWVAEAVNGSPGHANWVVGGSGGWPWVRKSGGSGGWPGSDVGMPWHVVQHGWEIFFLIWGRKDGCG